jgi:hypothetical protein
MILMFGRFYECVVGILKVGKKVKEDRDGKL